MRNLPKSVPTTAAPRIVPPRQLSIVFDSLRLRGMNTSERTKAIACLANILMQAAGVAMGSVTMTNADLLSAAVLKRKAVVYVRQSTQAQVQTNLESQRRQYELVDEAQRHGIQNVEVIDDDLGRSASGMTARPGFERLVAWLCAGEVGAVLCFDASRLPDVRRLPRRGRSGPGASARRGADGDRGRAGSGANAYGEPG